MAKRKVTAPGGGTFKAPEPPKSEIRQFGEAMDYMVDQMAKRFRHQVFEELNQSTVEKFATTDAAQDFNAAFPVKVVDKRIPYTVERTEWKDAAGNLYDENEVRRMGEDGGHEPDGLEAITFADTRERIVYRTDFVDMAASDFISRHGITDAQTGNFARVFLRLADRVRRKLVRQFDDERLEKMAKTFTGKVNRRNRDQFYRRIEKRIGISRKELEATEGLTFQINAYQLETFQWVRKMRDDTLQQWTSNTLRDMAEGKSLPDILSQFDGMVEKRRNHAEMVARTQISTFNSLVSKTRARNLGIEKAVWVTAQDERVRGRPGGKYPNAKPSHWWADGKEFDLAKGLTFPSGKTLLPGVDYNCFPGSVKVNHASLCQKLYRRWYTGELAELVRDDGVILRATPNHPVFTVAGFKPAGELNPSDHIVCTIDEGFDGVKLDGDDMIPTFEQLFRAVELLGVEHGVAPAPSGQFHGDVADSNIDVVRMDGLLMSEADASVRQKFAELNLSGTDQEIVLSILSCLGASQSGAQGARGATDSVMGLLDLVRARLLVHLNPLERFRFALGSWRDSSLQEPLPNGSSVNAETFGDSVFALSVLVHGLDAFDREIERFRAAPVLWHRDTKLLKLPRQGGFVDSDTGGGIPDGHAGLYKTCRIMDARVVNFSGHVYNLQTVSGDYIADTTAVSNCRCDYRMVIPEMDE